MSNVVVVCAWCAPVEVVEAALDHGMCPECADKFGDDTEEVEFAPSAAPLDAARVRAPQRTAFPSVRA